MVDELAGKSIGERIRSLRGKLLTQRQLADAAQVSIELIRKLEQGQRHTASIGSLHRIARALDVDIAELVGKPSALPSNGPDAGVMAIRRALTPVDDLLGETTFDGEAPTLAESQRLVNYGWALTGPVGTNCLARCCQAPSTSCGPSCTPQPSTRSRRRTSCLAAATG